MMNCSGALSNLWGAHREQQCCAFLSEERGCRVFRKEISVRCWKLSRQEVLRMESSLAGGAPCQSGEYLRGFCLHDP